MTLDELQAIQVRDAEAPDYGPTVGHDPSRTSHALINAFRDRRALLAHLAEAERDAALGRIAIRYVDRAGDYCEQDPAERICDEFSKAMHDEVERQWQARVAQDAATSVSGSGGER